MPFAYHYLILAVLERIMEYTNTLYAQFYYMFRSVINIELSTLAQSCSDLPGLPRHHLPPSPARLAMAIAVAGAHDGRAAAPLPLVALIRQASSRR